MNEQANLLPKTQVNLSQCHIDAAAKKVALALFYLHDAQAAIDSFFQGWPHEEALAIVPHRYAVGARENAANAQADVRAIQYWLNTITPPA